MTSTFNQVKDILVDRFALQPASVLPQTDLQKELGLDSMDALDLLSAVNEVFSTRVPVELLEKIHTVAQLVEAVDMFRSAGGNRRTE